MADKPSENSANPLAQSLRSVSREKLPAAGASPADFEIRLQSTEKIKVMVQRCGRCSAPEHLLVRIRETLISISSGNGWPPSH